jgi:ATP-binding cassette subfamily C exporter for protease/lipase
VYVVLELLEYVRARLLHEVGRAADAAVAPRVFAAIFEARLRGVSGASTQALSDWRTIRDFLPSPFVLSLLELPVSAVFIAILFWVNPLLGWVALGGALVQLAIALLTERSTQPPLAEANRQAVQAQLYADNALRSVEVVEALGFLRAVHQRWFDLQRKFLSLQAKASASAGAFQAISRNVQLMLSSALLGLACWLMLQNDLHGGPAMMVVASIIGARSLQPLVQMVAQWRSLVGAREAWSRLQQLLASMPERRPGLELPAPKGRLTVEQLMGGPPAPPGMPAMPIVRGVQFVLEPGELLAVVGPSAAGKTSLARLLIGLWPALSGKVRLDGADVFQWHKDQLGPYIGYLPQGVELFEGTIAENVARFGEVDRAKVQAALHAVGLQALLASLPDGIDTEIGPDGAVLSGGQRQRVALARALYDNPALLVLDEPNSSLDEAGDAALLEALKAAKARGATVVVMTHRTSVLEVADKMLVMVDGAQQAFGPRDQVLQALQQRQNAAAQAAAAAAAAPTVALPANPESRA